MRGVSRCRNGSNLLTQTLSPTGRGLLHPNATALGGIVGHIAFSRLTVDGPGPDVRAVALAPLAVAPGRQRAGIGGALVRRGLDELRAQGEELALVLGDPGYYGRFGFSAEAAQGLAMPYDGPALQALWLASAPAVDRAVVR